MKTAISATILALLSGLKPYGTPSPQELGNHLVLSGSRGEVLNFTLNTPSSECLTLKASELQLKKDPAQKIRVAFKFYEILPFETKNPSYRGAKTGTHWDPVIPHAKTCTAWTLGEFEIPANTPTGIYNGTIASGAASIPIELKVWPMQMPDRPSMPLYAEYTPWYGLLGHYGKWHEGEAQLSKKYIERMLQHRMIPLKHHIRPLSIVGDSINLRHVNGAASVDSFISAVVQPLPDWALISVPLHQTEGATPESIAKYYRMVHQALKKEGLLERSFVYLWDEPSTQDIPQVKKLAQTVRDQAPDLKIMITTTYRKDLADLVDIFVPVMDQFDRPGFAKPDEYARLWLYASCMSHGCGNAVDSGSPDWVIDRPGASVRSQGWIAQLYKLDALLYYSVNNSYQFYPGGRDPWKDLWEFSGNGDGTLFYPGRPGMHGLKEHQPIESLRLKLWRQSSYDAEYIKWMNEARTRPAWWPGRLKEVVRNPRDWERSDASYRGLREQIGDTLGALVKE